MHAGRWNLKGPDVVVQNHQLILKTPTTGPILSVMRHQAIGCIAGCGHVLVSIFSQPLQWYLWSYSTPNCKYCTVTIVHEERLGNIFREL